MRIVILEMLFVLTTSTKFGKHVYVSTPATWSSAQNYCRQFHTDLSSFPTRLEVEELKQATAGKVIGDFWIGLYKNGTKWYWSGGGLAINIQWDTYEPTGGLYDTVARGCLSCQWLGWRDINVNRMYPFFCLSLNMNLNIKMTWEQALGSCKQNDTTLKSLTSQTELLQVMEALKRSSIAKLWIGLRYLGDRWLWVDRTPLGYTAWAQGGDQDYQCPVRKRCGALNVDGVWEGCDCTEELNFICD